MADRLAGDASANDASNIMLVGHMPHIQRLLRLLLEGTSEGITAFPTHGIVALEPKNQNWVECWRLETEE